MKALFIWREESKFFIKNIVERNKQFTEGLLLIDSKEKFESEESLNSYNRIFVLAELGWDKTKLFQGYEIGLDIIKKREDKAPCIIFFSISFRKDIYKMIDDQHKFIVKSFPFVDLTKVNSNYKFPTKEMNASKWKFITTYALEQYGILDVISHRLDSLNQTNSGFEKNIINILEELKSYKSFTDKEIQKFILNCDKNKINNNFVFGLKRLIDNRIEELTSKTTTKRFKFPNNLNVVVVEDEKHDADIILDCIKQHYNGYKFEEKVTYFNNGKRALEYIKSKKDTIDILITDLQLLDKDGFYQEVQGVEIFEEAKKYYNTAIGVITGFGRKGVNKLLQHKDILLKKHLKTFNANEEIDNFLKDLVKQYTRKIRNNNFIVGPIIGWMNEKHPYRKYYTTKVKEDKELQAKKFKKAHHFFELYGKDNLSKETSGWSPLIKVVKDTKPEDLFKKHHLFWAHRLIILDYAFRNDFVLNKDGFDKKFEGILYRKLTKQNLSDFGIHTDQLYNKNDVIVVDDIIKEGIYNGQKIIDVKKVKPKNLFPEERELFEEYLKEEDITIGNQSKELTEWLVNNFEIHIQYCDIPNLSFSELIQELKNIIKKVEDGEIEDEVFDLIIEDMPKKIQQFFTNEESVNWKEVYKKIFDLATTVRKED